MLWERGATTQILSEGLLQRCKGQFGTRTLPSGNGFNAASHPCAPLCLPPRRAAAVKPGTTHQGEKLPWCKK